MKKVCLFLTGTFVFFSFIPGHAQTSSELPNNKRSGLFFTGALHYPNFTEINTMLADSGLATFSKQQYAWGIGFTHQCNAFILQLDGFKYSQCVDGPNESCSHIYFSSFGATIGYNLIHKSKFSVYPSLGLYYSRTEFIEADNDLPAMPFSSYLTSVKNIAQITHYNFNAYLGASFDYFLTTSKKNNAGILLGLRTGYYLPINNSPWFEHEDEVELQHPPKVNAAAFCVKAAVGFFF